jgi:hypothetical protein
MTLYKLKITYSIINIGMFEKPVKKPQLFKKGLNIEFNI